MKNLLVFLLSSILMNCNAQRPNDAKAKQIIAASVKAHGGKAFKKMDVSFKFRQFQMNIKLNGSLYEYTRTQTDTSGRTIVDLLDNQSYTRKIDGQVQELNAKDQSRFKEGVNSVAYFMLLPYKLQDAAVNAEYAGTAIINGESYNKVKIWFEKEGGGKDHDDIFCYWFNQKTNLLDYLAYDNGGPRFRKATKRHAVGKFIFQDYENHEILDKSVATYDYDTAFKEGKSKLFSKIENSDFVVK